MILLSVITANVLAALAWLATFDGGPALSYAAGSNRGVRRAGPACYTRRSWIRSLRWALVADDHSQLDSSGQLPYEAHFCGALAAIDPLCIRGVVDSGCTAHVTFCAEWLVNLRPCNETFKAANGKLAKATAIGDLPVVARAEGGGLATFTIRDVRLVPEFGYTLLSVDQLWDTQRADARFADDRSLYLAASPATGGKPATPRVRVPFQPRTAESRLPVVHLASASRPELLAPHLKRAGSAHATHACVIDEER